MAIQIDLKGQAALVTGATGQLGRVMARTLALCGADIGIHFFQNRAMAETLAGEIQSMGSRAVVVQADVGNRESVDSMASTVSSALGDPSIVVANAVSQIHPWKPLLEEEIEDYVNQFNTCVMQSVLLAKAFVPAMAAKHYGRFIAINTECAMQLDVTQSAYGAAKRGLDGLLRVLAKEVGPHGITVNQVAPGWTISDADRAQGTESRPEYESTVPLRRRGTDQEVANAVAFLASPLFGFITGAYIPVCGGNVMPAI